MSDLNKLKKFLNDDYRASYLDSHVKGSIAYQIRELREKLGLNQTQFGELVGMPQAVISRLENAEGGAVNVNTLLKIANGLKIGLAIRFGNFETVLKEDVSPAGLAVESVQQTIDRYLKLAEPPPPGIPLVQANQYTIESTATWQTNISPNQQWLLQGSAIRNSGTYTQTPASPE